MRKSLLLYVLLGIFVAAGLTWIGVRVWRAHRVDAIVRSGLPAKPDASRWSKTLVDQVDKLTQRINSADRPVEALADLARVYQANGCLPEAAISLQALRQLQPENPKWAYYQADLRSKANDPEGAIALVKEATRLAPDYAPGLILLGDLLIRQHRYPEARQAFESCQFFAPKDPRVGANLAYLDSVAGNIRGGLQRLDEVLKENPQFAGGHHLRGAFLTKLGNLAGAEEEKRLERSCPPFAASDPWIDELSNFCYDAYRLQMVAAGLCRAGRYTEAIPYLQRSVELSPGDATFYDTWADANLMVGNLEAARDALAKGMQAVPDAPILHIRMAVLLCKMKHADDALAVVDRALQKWPDDPEVIAARGHCLLIAGRTAEAVEAFQAALSRNSGLAEAHYSLGTGLQQLDRLTEAKQSFEQALQVRPAYVEPLIALAGLAMQAGDINLAESYAPQLRALAGTRREAARAYAEIVHLRANQLAGEGKMAEAERAYRDALNVDPSLPLLHAGLGMVCMAMHRPAEALPELKRFAELAPTDLQAYAILGHVQAELGQKEEAKKTYEIAIRIAKFAGSAEAAADFEKRVNDL